MIGSTLGVLTASWIGISVIYNWAYFNGLQSNYLGLMTIQDHLLSLTDWFPSVAIVFSLCLVFDYAVAGDLNARHRKNLTRAARRGRMYVLLGCALLAFIVPIYSSAAKEPGWNALMGLIFCVTWWSLKEIFISSTLAEEVTALITIPSLQIPYVIAIASTLSFASGLSDGNIKRGDYDITMKSGITYSYTKPVRYLQNGIIFVDPLVRRAVYLPWGDVARVEQVLRR